MLHFFFENSTFERSWERMRSTVGFAWIIQTIYLIFPRYFKMCCFDFWNVKILCLNEQSFPKLLFFPSKKFHRNLFHFSFFLPKWNGYTSQYFWIPGFCATAICTKGLCHLEILQRIPVPAFLRNSLLFVNFFVRNWNLFVCFCRGAKAPYRQKQKKVSVPTKKLKKEQVPKKKLVQNPL